MSLPDRSGLIDRTSYEQVWAQIARMIRADITDGTFTAGHRLPSETDLADQYGVARMTARKAVAQLAADGVVTIVHGRGTFVTQTG